MRDLINSVSSALKKARSLSNVIGDSLAEIRSRIEDLKDRRDEILSLPVNVEVAVERAEKWARYQVVSAQQAAPGPAHFCISPKRWNDAYHPHCDPGVAALAYLGSAFIEAVKQEVIAAYGDDQGVTESERQDLVAQNDHEILEAELSEESIIRQAEQQGMTIDRREDADPRAVLAHDSNLP